jgi:hypothetical protein
MKFSRSKIILFSVVAFACIAVGVYYCWPKHSTNNTDEYANTAELAMQDSSSYTLQSVKDRMAIIKTTLAAAQPVITINYAADANKQAAQTIAINHPTFSTYYKDKNGAVLLNEIFTVYQALPSDVKGGVTANQYRVEMYNYAYNTSIVGIVDVATKQLVSSQVIPSSAPDIPEHLKKIAVDIAIHSANVKAALGEVPEIKDAEMAYTKTALNKSKCERSLHLCVAPTFVKDGKALWTIIDLTDLRLVGTRWTNVGDPGPVRVTERTLQNDKISECYCKTETPITKNDWSMQYMMTSSDGLRIADVKYKNKLLVTSAKLVDWHVSYSNTDGFGYSDGAGCPTFSLSAVLAIDAPKVVDLVVDGKVVGWVLEQKFQSEGWPRACNYNYLQRYEFYNDGRWRMTAASLGRGCGNDGTYRPVFRIAFAGATNFAEHNGDNFTMWEKENWTIQKETTTYNDKGIVYQIAGFGVEPGRGQFGDKGRGDNAFVYVTKNNKDIDEGESDLVTIGPCCNIDYQQGPEKFLNKQSISNTDLVLWYVPQMKNDDTKGKEYCWAEAKIVNGVYQTNVYPCLAGPMFVPIK